MRNRIPQKLSSIKELPLELFALYFVMFLVVAGFGIVLPFLPFFAKALGANSTELGLMVTLYSLSQVIAAPLWGRVSDKIGRKPVLIFGLVGFALSFFLLVMVKTVLAMMLARALGGLLSASAFPAAQAYLIDMTTTEKRSYAVSYMAAASNLGFFLGPALGAIFARLGISTAFSISGGSILVAALLAWILLPAVKSTQATHALVPLKLSDLRGLLLGRSSILLWNILLVSFGASTMYSILGYYMIDKFGAQANATALIYTLMGGVSALFQGLLVGRMLMRWGENWVVVFSLLLGMVSFVGLVLAGSLSSLYAWVTLISISLALVRPSLMVAISKQTRLGQGLTMGLQGSFDSMGRVIGPLWAGWIFGIFLGGPYWSAAAIFGLATCIHLLLFTPLAKVSPSPLG